MDETTAQRMARYKRHWKALTCDPEYLTKEEIDWLEASETNAQHDNQHDSAKPD